LMLERSRTGTVSCFQPTIEAEVKWRFRFTTFVSIQEQHGPPTVKEALVSPTTAFIRSSLNSRSSKMVWTKWKPTEDNKSNSSIESKQSLWLTLPRSEVSTPTFWTAFLSRRYSICIQLKVTQLGTAKLEVEIPIQVGIDAPLGNGRDGNLVDAVPGYAEFDLEEINGDELLPQYHR